MDFQQFSKKAEALLVSPEYHQLQKALTWREPNLWHILEVSGNENIISRFLAWLLNPRANHSLGDKLFGRGQRKDAAKYYERAWSLQSSDEKLITRLAEIYESLGQTKKAMDSYARAMEINPKDKLKQKKYMEMASKLKDSGALC